MSLYSEFAKFNGQVPWKISDVLFTYVAIFVISLIFIGFLLFTNADTNMVAFSAMFQLFISIATLFVIYTIVTKKYGLSFLQAFGINFEKTPSFLSTGLLIAFLIILVTSGIGIIFSEFLDIESPNPYQGMPKERFQMLSFLAIFIAPVVEEIFFRGFMQPALIKSTGTVPGIVITAIIFGVSHTQYLDFSTALVSVVAIGLILGVTKYKTGSVMPGIFAHFFNNLLAVFALSVP